LRARLFARTGELAGASYEIGTGALIGRGSESDIRLRNRLLSRRHARIAWDPALGAYVVEDLGSANGTRVGGLPVRGREPLGRLELIDFGGAQDFVFQLLDASPGPPAPAGAPRDARARVGLRLVIAGVPHALVPGENLVGRAHDARVRLETAEASRRHAVLCLADGRVTLRDLGSRNGTFVDGARVDGAIEVAPGARIRFGSVLARLDSDG
jgi:pSer/pThr/pTyr-binding forkhead associated (FHA) protein